MPILTPAFIPHGLNAHERKLLDCAARGKECRLYDERKAKERFEELEAVEARTPEDERRDEITLLGLAVRE